MTTTISSWSEAGADDREIILALMREFYAEEKLVYDERRAARSISALLGDPAVGVVLLLRDDSGVCGYLVGSLGFTLEFGGKFALLDELYIRAPHRGRGEGKRALAAIEMWAKKQGAATVRLEVTAHNSKALAIYLKTGYIDDQRRILTKWIDVS
jgi:GNAT superfamily N-acetyltransferase